MKLIKAMAMVLLTIFFTGGSYGQDKEGTDRKPAVAGQFYPDNPAQLEAQLSDLFMSAEPAELGNVIAIVSPHAGYVFSGQVAASAFNQVDDERSYENVFVIASSHHVSFDGASIYNIGDYLTPLGRVNVNQDLARKLVEENKVFTYRRDAHLHEHSLEVQLPFLQHRLGEGFSMIPIVIGTQDPGTCRVIAGALKPYFKKENLFVISTDFSHYPSYEDALIIDGLTADAIITGKPEELLVAIEKNRKRKVPNLATSLCGWTSVLTLMYLTGEDDRYEYHKVQYQNSGDAPLYGDKYRVVGYNGLAVTFNEKKDFTGFGLSQSEQKELLAIARQSIEGYLTDRIRPDIDPSTLGPAFKENYGAFVTLHKDGKLRGCIGRFNPEDPLYLTIQNMAIAAATQDYRFPAVTPEEMESIEIEISVLSPMVRIADINEIENGKHGIYIKKGYSSGTLLPQVATEQNWTIEEFLGHCARDKARIGWDGWKDAELYVYEAFIFGEKLR